MGSSETFVMTTQTCPSGTQKVRRISCGCKRPEGHRFQIRGQQIRRPNPSRIRVTTGDTTLTSVAGLVEFGTFANLIGLDKLLCRQFDHLKQSASVVYPMHSILRLLIDANLAGESRVFGLESLAADALFVHLAGSAVPSIDVVYDDLRRLSDVELAALEAIVAQQGLEALRRRKHSTLHIDIDTTVEVVFGLQEGAEAGPNPRDHGRPSYHPILAVCRETGTVVGALLRPGNTGLGDDDAPTIATWIERVRRVVGSQCDIRVRIDAAGDCAELLQTLDEVGATYNIKAKLTRDLRAAITTVEDWETVEVDGEGRSTLAGADIPFARASWREHDLDVRVVAVRSRERLTGKQICLWDDDELTVHAYLTNDRVNAPDVIALDYDGRAAVEPVIGELKSGMGLGKVPSSNFNANHTAFLIKLLAFNLLMRFATHVGVRVSTWRTPWLRRLLICRPGRLVCSGRRYTLHTGPVQETAPPRS